MAFYYIIRVIAIDCVLEIEMGQSPKELDGGGGAWKDIFFNFPAFSWNWTPKRGGALANLLMVITTGLL